MSDERLKLQMVDAVYGELDDRALAQLREAVAKDPELDADLRSLEATRRLYAEDALPEPADLLSEAILRQEKILRQAPEPWWSRLWQLAWHPAVGLTALVVVVATAGLLVKLSTPPAPEAAPAVTAVTAELEPAPAAPQPPPPPATATAEVTTAGGKAAEQAEDKRRAADGLLPVTPSPDLAETPTAGDAPEAEPKPMASKDSRLANAASDKQKGGDGFEKREEMQAAPERKAPSAWDGSRGRALNKAVGEAMDDETGGLSEEEAVVQAKQDSWGLRSTAKAPADVAPAPRADSDRERQAEAPTYAQRSAKPHPAAPFAQTAPTGPAPGSAGQLTDPALLGRDTGAMAPSGAAGNVAAESSFGDDLGTGSSSAQPRAPAKKARPLPSLQDQAPREQLKTELNQISKLQYAQKAESYLSAGEVAFDQRNFEEALGHFLRAQQMDRANTLAPLPQIGQARSLFKLKRYRDAAAIYERVLDGYPTYGKRAQVAGQLAACYEALGNTVAAKRARRMADESRTVLDAVETTAPAAAEPAQATPAAK